VLLENELNTIINRSNARRRLLAEPLVLDLLEASALTGISSSTLYKWITEAGIGVRFGPGIMLGAGPLRELLARKGAENALRDLQHAIALSSPDEQRLDRPGRRTA
jgi:predicted DNA-binding transcriptional regulator AlpA